MKTYMLYLTVLTIVSFNNLLFSQIHVGMDISGTFDLSYPSEIEGFGLPITEGMTAGIPVCALDTEVSREVGGVAVSYFSPTVASLVSSIKESCNLTKDKYLLKAAQAKAQLFKIQGNDISKAFDYMSKKVNK